MDLDQLKAFVLVSEKGNLSRAAKGLGLTPFIVLIKPPVRDLQ